MGNPKKKTKKVDKPDSSKDPQFEKLIKQAECLVKSDELDPTLYNNDTIRRWLSSERSKRPINIDFSADLAHLKLLGKWDEHQFFGLLFGLNFDGISRHGLDQPVVGRGLERIACSPSPENVSELAKILLPDNYQPNPPTSRLAKNLFELMPESSPWWRLRYEIKLDIEGWHISALQAREKLRGILMSHGGIDEESGISLGKNGHLEFTVKYFAPWLLRFNILKWLEDEGCKIPEGLREFLKDLETLIRKKAGRQASPAPTTGRAKTVALKAKARSIYNKLKSRPKSFTYNDILNHSDWPDALEDSGYNRSHTIPVGTVQNWLTNFRKSS